MQSRPLYGRIGFWLREFADTGEGSVTGVIQTLQQFTTATCLCLKVADGTNWVGSYDSKTPINNTADLVAVKQQCESLAFAFLPVVVPRGVSGEAALHASIAVACGSLMVDAEPYSGFYDSANPAQFPQNYAQPLRQASGDAYLIAEPDPRTAGWTELNMPAALVSFDALCAQHYIGWQAVSWMNLQQELNMFLQQDVATGKDLYVTIYGADPTFPAQNILPVQFWNAVQSKALGCCVFAFGPMNGQQLTACKQLIAPRVQPDPIGPQPAPPTTLSALRQQVGLYAANIAADVLDPDLADTDVLPRAQQTAQGILSALVTP